MIYYFEVKGTIDAQSIEDADDIIRLTLEDNGCKIKRLDLVE